MEIHFKKVKKYYLKKKKKENASYQHSLLFPQCFNSLFKKDCYNPRMCGNGLILSNFPLEFFIESPTYLLLPVSQLSQPICMDIISRIAF